MSLVWNRFWNQDTSDYRPDFPGLKDWLLVTPQPADAAIIDRDIARNERDADRRRHAYPYADIAAAVARTNDLPRPGEDR